MQNMPGTRFVAGGGMAGFAQLGIVVFVGGGSQRNLQGTVVVAGWCRRLAAGFGAGGGAQGEMYCGMQSSWGAGHVCGCSGLLMRYWGDGGQGAGEGNTARS